jgi:hypothetical protein
VAFEVESYGWLGLGWRQDQFCRRTRNSECSLESVRLKDSRLTLQIDVEGIHHRITRVREDREYHISSGKSVEVGLHSAVLKIITTLVGDTISWAAIVSRVWGV